MKKNKLLPIGSIVCLHGGTAKVMVISRGSIFKQNEKDVYADYMGMIYPMGFDPDNGVFFNEDDIDKVIFTGYSDGDESRYIQLYENWKKENKVEKAKI